MKNILSIITGVVIGALLVLGVVVYFGEKTDQEPESDDEDKSPYSQDKGDVKPEEGYRTYKDPFSGLTVTYSKQLTATFRKNGITLMHSIPYKHPDPCDFQGNGEELTSLIDADFSLDLYENSPLLKTIKTLKRENLLTNGQLKVSEGFIDTYTVGNLKGYQVLEGVEGCGNLAYYFPMRNNTATLVVKRKLITELSENVTNYEANRKLPGVISPSSEQALFIEVLTKLTY